MVIMIKKFLKYVQNNTFNDRLNQLKSDGKRKIILMGSPEYNNIGDSAIAFATKKFVEKEVSDKSFYEFTENDILFNIYKLKKHIKKDDILLLQGGGNFSNLYPDQEIVRKKIVDNFDNNKIIVMPQTLYYTDNYELPKYYDSDKIFFFARESKSFDYLKKHKKKNVFLCPDIVMSLIDNEEYSFSKSNNFKKCLICLRNDLEVDKSRVNETELKNSLNNLNISYKNISTVVNYNIPLEKRDDEILEFLKKINEYDFVITDRLHGMILSAITHTPCIVLPTFNYKVTESYNWLVKTKIVYLLDKNELSNIESILRNFDFDTKYNLKDYFIGLIEEMK